MKPYYMPFFVSAYREDTMDLRTIEHGAYLLLIFEYWARQGPLTDDDVKLANITRLAVREWMKIRPHILPFFTVDGGSWHHKRIDSEIKIAQEKSSKARESAGRRWNGVHANA